MTISGALPPSTAENQATFRLRKSAPVVPVERVVRDPRQPLEVTARAFRAFREEALPGKTVDFWYLAFPGPREHAQLFRDLHSHDVEAADRLARALTSMPQVGSEFLGFRLLAELGRGGFARVYLAQQGDLANRHVVLKVSADVWGEANTLAQLQHPNIVPVYSAHQQEPFQVVCMPYRGWTTLQDILLGVEVSLPTSGAAIVKMFKKAPAIVGNAPMFTAAHPFGTPFPSASFVEKLAGRTYVEVIVGLASQLAEGLAHAHSHGIVHHDLKPANVLLADDGDPMLLDFNAAEDTKRKPGAMVAWVAGTLPYMAPEQLLALQGKPAPLDARCDLYAFGVILFELLTGRYPFKFRDSSIASATIFDRIVEDRHKPLPHPRQLNPAISPALEAIVLRCLEADPDRRYQSARELHEDLQRQHTHRPLLHMTEPSLSERGYKWVRRHPEVLTAGVVAAFFAVLLAVVGLVSIIRGEQIDQFEKLERARVELQEKHDRAQGAWQKFQDEMKSVQFLLYTRTSEPDQLATGVAVASRLVDSYAARADPAWQQSDLVRTLPASEQQRLGDAMGEVLLLLARALFLQQGTEAREDLLHEALRLNERAAACSSAIAESPALWRQRASLNKALGRDAAARAAQAKANALRLRTASDHYWLASDYIAREKLREALPLLQQAAYLEPQNFWAWFVLANGYDRLALDARAEGCYAACIALRPEFHWAHFNRGLALLRQQDYRAACADFDTVINLRPDLSDAYWNRALAHQGLQHFAEAERDLTTALERGGRTRLYFLRARVREKLGDKEGARRDLDEGLRLPPTDEKSWVSRGFYRLNTDPVAALADFDEALRLNPRSADALQNKAHVLAEKLGRNAEALDALNKALLAYPDSVKARGGRGVLLARLGQRQAAIQDAEESLARDASPMRLYQVACIYALTSKEQPEDRLQAFQLLSSALRKGYGFNLLDSDPDLNPIRGLPEFRRLAEGARSLRPSAPKAAKRDAKG